MHPAVFDWVKTNMQAMAGGDVTFYETLGAMMDDRNLPDLWLTMDLDSSADVHRLTIGRPAIMRELGTFTAVFVSKSGRGIAGALAAGQRFVDMLNGDAPGQVVDYYQTELVEESGKQGILRIESVGSPNSAPFEDGNWILVSVACVYSYSSLRGAAVRP